MKENHNVDVQFALTGHFDIEILETSCTYERVNRKS